jgi:5-dehydro-2-deoxygluconokinase
VTPTIGDRFLVIGRAGMDLYADPPGASVETAERFTTALGGSAANIAVGLVRLGCRATLATCISDDAVGLFVRAQLKRYGIETEHIRLAGHPYRNSLAVTETRLADCQNVIYRNGAADLALSAGQIVGIDFSEFSALVLTGTVFSAEPSRQAGLAAIAQARAAGCPVILDIDYRATAWPSREEAASVCVEVVGQSDIVVGNGEEFDVVAGRPGGGRALAESLAADTGKTCIYKMGQDGSVAFAQGETIETPAFEIESIKPMGAGDAFMAGLLAALAGDRPLPEAIRRGSAAAAIVVSCFGCAPAMPDTGELDAFLVQHSSQRHRIQPCTCLPLKTRTGRSSTPTIPAFRSTTSTS